MGKEVFNRHEEKYIIHEDIYQALLTDLSPYIEFDQYNKDGEKYTIYNIYLDTLNDRYIQESLDKPLYKHKLRIRSYNKWEETEYVYLEIKKKFDGVVNKRRTQMTYSDALFFIENGQVPYQQDYMNPQIINELSFLLNQERVYPKVKIQYDRIAFYCTEKNDLRISFDCNILSERYNGLKQNLLHPQFYILEIKTNDSFPLWLCDILAKYELKSQSFSKYGREYSGYLQSEPQFQKVQSQDNKLRSLQYGIAI